MLFYTFKNHYATGYKNFFYINKTILKKLTNCKNDRLPKTVTKNPFIAGQQINN